MKIIHLCMTGSYNDYWNYQDNLLSLYHKKAGFDVTIITTPFINDKNSTNYIFYKTGEYIDDNGIKVIRKDLLISNSSELIKRLRLYKNLYATIEQEKADIIFVHGCQFLDIKHVVKYAKLHPNVKIYVDNHADLSNSARNFLSKNILHKIIWRYCAHQIEPYTTKFYGVLPARVDFLINVYKLAKEKVELLVMGADDEKVAEAKKSEVRKRIREKHNIGYDDFLIVTGGKIDNAKKQTLLLMEAVKRIENKKIKLVVFGSLVNDLKDKVNELADGDKIQYIGWINSEDSYEYFAASDLVVFPGRHSVFWEQVVGLGIPMIVKYWDGTTHVDLGGNCKFLYHDNIEEIYNILIKLIDNKKELSHMREIAESKGMKYFSYKDISARAIEVQK